MDFRNSFGLISSPIFSILEDFSDEPKAEKSRNENHNQPSRAYVRDAKAMAATPADVIEYPNAYAITMDMPGIKADEIKVTVENGNVLVVSGERKRDIDAPEGTENGDHNHGYEKRSDGGVKYLRMERRMGKFMRKFRLPENADMETVAANCRDGVLTVRLEKVPPPEPKRPKTIQVKDA